MLRMLRAVMFVSLTLYFYLYHRLRVTGKENIPKDRVVIVASNHASYLDPPLVGYAFYPGYLRFIAWDKLFSFAPFGFFLRVMGSLPVSQENKNSSASLLLLVMGFLAKGENVFICPEGQRTTDGNLQPLKGGVALLSLKSGAPVVPVWVGGTYRALSPSMRFPRPCKIYVDFGKPIDPTFLPNSMTEKEKRRHILEKLEEYYRKMDEEDRKRYPRK